MHRHIIVSGDDALATTIADELKNAGLTIVRVLDAETSEAGVAGELALHDVAHALAVVCAGDDDARHRARNVSMRPSSHARKSSPSMTRPLSTSFCASSR